MKKLVLIACALAGFVGSSFAGWGFGNSTQFYGSNGQYLGQAYQNGGILGGGYSYYGANGQYLGRSYGQ